MSMYAEYLEQRERFRKLTIKEQLEELEKNSQEDDVIIGEIYVQNPPEFNDRTQLKQILGNALLVEESTVMGQGDNAVNLLFSVNNLLIGVTYFAYWRNPLSMIPECKVYRISEKESLENLDLKKVKKVFGY